MAKTTRQTSSILYGSLGELIDELKRAGYYTRSI